MADSRNEGSCGCRPMIRRSTVKITANPIRVTAQTVVDTVTGHLPPDDAVQSGRSLPLPVARQPTAPGRPVGAYRADDAVAEEYSPPRALHCAGWMPAI